MITANTAHNTAQIANKKNWLNLSFNRIESKILKAAQSGRRTLLIEEFSDIFQGSENLYEVAEMAIHIQRNLEVNGFKVIVTPEAYLHISW